MTFTTIFIIAGVVLLFIFILIAKLAIRWMHQDSDRGRNPGGVVGGRRLLVVEQSSYSQAKANAATTCEQQTKCCFLSRGKIMAKSDTDDAADPLRAGSSCSPAGNAWPVAPLPRSSHAMSSPSV